MTSVDSGVETGNDSNDSSIVQHESLPSNQINNVCTIVATTNNGENETRESRASALLVEMVPRSLHTPLQTLCSVTENFRCSDDTQSSSKIFAITTVPNYYCGKIKSVCWARAKNRYIPWKRFGVGQKLMQAAALNNTELARSYLRLGASPNDHDDKGRTALHIAACRTMSIQIVEYLTNISSILERHSAVGYKEMAEILLQHGANPNQRDCLGNTPLHLATVTNQISVVTLLLNAGSDVLSLDQRGYNPLQLAMAKLKLLQSFTGEDMLRVKEEVNNIINMLLAYLQKRKEAREKVETLSNFYSRLTLSNTTDQVQDDVKDLLANLDALNITN